MASIVATNAFQALSVETESRKVSNAQKCCSSFVGDISQLALSSCKTRPAQWSRSLHALCVHMDSRFSDGTWKRPAVALPDYAIANSDFDISSLTKGFAHDLDESSLRMGSLQPENSGRALSSLGLRHELVDALHKRGITHLFPIQEAVLKPATEGMDLIARARTGTGKTLAFGIPIIQSLMEENEQNNSRRRNRNPRVLVLAPTRELAMQVEKEFMESAPNLSTLCVYGGVSIVGQQRKLQRGVDIAVGTPGRVMDLIERGSLELREIRYLVLDEADQMLAVGFEEDVEKILEHVPDNRQSMLFSATMPAWVSKLARKYLKSPLKIDLVGDSKEKLAEGIKMLSIASPGSAKRSILSDLITVYGKGGKTIVFTQTKKDADEVALSMNRMLGTEALHGDISQAQREKTLAAFREGRFSVLVATDVAARGLDIPNVDLVIHYEIPNDPETFVHRSGRTGRAGKEGTTILMHSDSQKRTLRMIERDVGCNFQPINAPTSHHVLQASSEQARDALGKVHPDLRSVFLPTAKMLLQEQGVDALAAAIAHLSGFTQPPASRSLITHEQGWMTLQFTRDQTTGRGGLSSAGGVLGALGSIYPKAADEVGKIIMLDPSQGMGAVFDLPEDVAKEVLQLELAPEDSIQVISKLPMLQYADAPRDSYGRFSQRGGRPRGRELNDSPSWSSRGSRSSNMGMRRGQQQWSTPSRRAPQGNDRFQRSSTQTCFICGEAGHRAAVCPSR